MVQQYNKQLSNNPKYQSLLGAKKPLKDIKADSLIMAEVVKVNYLYNTVELRTIKNHEMLVKGEETSGQFSAKLPVNFGGSYSNGKTYGQTVPINVGDQVLVSFLQGDTTAPIVIGIYKSSATAYELAPTNLVSGSPDVDLDNLRETMENFTLYPSQTYDWVSGEGDRETTLQGRSFMKSGVRLFGSSRLNDYGFNYEDLERYHLRGRDIIADDQDLPQVMFQHNSTFAQSKTNVLFDDDSSLSISKINNDAEDKARSEFRLVPSSDNAYIRTQEDNKKHDDSSSYTEVGTNLSESYLVAGDHKLSLNKDGKLLIDGKPVGIGGGGQTLDELSKIIQELQLDVSKLKQEVSEDMLDRVQELETSLSSLRVDLNSLTQDYQTVSANVKEVLANYDSLEAKVRENTSDISNLVVQISNAAGSFTTLNDRLNSMDSKVSAVKLITDEVINSRKDNSTGVTYDSLGLRLDTLSKDVAKLVELTSDLETIKENISNLQLVIPEMQDQITRMDNTLETLIGGQSVDTTYLVTITTNDAPVIEPGSGNKITLNVMVVRNGLDISGAIKDSDIQWTRVSNNYSMDSTWNANHSTPSKSLVVGEEDIITRAKFRASFIDSKGDSKVIPGTIDLSVNMGTINIDSVVSTNISTNQTYNSITSKYEPDYRVKPIELTLRAYLPGTTVEVTDSITDVVWTTDMSGSVQTVDSSLDGYNIRGTNNNQLVISTNTPASQGSVTIGVFGIYHDTQTGSKVSIRATTRLNIVSTAQASYTADLYSTTGEIIVDGLPARVTLMSDLYKLGTLSSDSRRYKLFAQDPKVTDTSNAGYDADGGLGWRSIYKSTDNYELSSDFNASVSKSLSITIDPKAVINIQTYKLLIITDDNTSTKYVTLRNMDSTMSVVITTQTGFLLSSDQESTTLIARLYSRGKEVDTDGSEYIYKWYAYNQDASLLPNFGGTGVNYRSGKEIIIARDEIPGDAITLNTQVETK